MALNKATGNQYPFITHTWNPIKGICPHGCKYCYVKRIYRRFNKEQPAPYLDERDMTTNLGKNNVIFVGSSIDMFAFGILRKDIDRVLEKCCEHENVYLFQTRNVERMKNFLLPVDTVIGTTIETNRYKLAGSVTVGPSVLARIHDMQRVAIKRKLITIEPIMDFDLSEFVEILRDINPAMVAIGADSGHNGLPEPPKEKVLELISELEKFTTVIQKKNLKRITGEAA